MVDLGKRRINILKLAIYPSLTFLLFSWSRVNAFSPFGDVCKFYLQNWKFVFCKYRKVFFLGCSHKKIKPSPQEKTALQRSFMCEAWKTKSRLVPRNSFKTAAPALRGGGWCCLKKRQLGTSPPSKKMQRESANPIAVACPREWWMQLGVPVRN